MKDPFSRAKAIHQNLPGGLGAAAAPAATPQTPMQQGPKMAQAIQPQMNFIDMTKQMGLSHLKLNKNPAMARTELMTHLAHKFGPNYMDRPEVKNLLEAFNQQANPASPTGSSQKTMGADTGQAKNLQALLGNPS